MFGILQNLKGLRIYHSFIKHAACGFATTWIDVLDVSYNEIEQVNLQFSPNSMTNLEVVRLNYTKRLANFNLALIGRGMSGV
ncbi:unnamed protein product [Candida parapsilosis]